MLAEYASRYPILTKFPLLGLSVPEGYSAVMLRFHRFHVHAKNPPLRSLRYVLARSPRSHSM